MELRINCLHLSFGDAYSSAEILQIDWGKNEVGPISTGGGLI
jgi:hypothetical protein